jgi:hypothetical protein
MRSATSTEYRYELVAPRTLRGAAAHAYCHMPLPVSPTCPLCAADLPISKAWLRAFGYRALLPWRSFGVRCSRCGAPLLVIKGRATAIAVGLVLAAAALSGFAWVKSAAFFGTGDDDSGPLLAYLAGCCSCGSNSRLRPDSVQSGLFMVESLYSSLSTNE